MGECYGGGSIAGAIFGTLFGVFLVALILWWVYKKYVCDLPKDTKLVADDDPESGKQEYAFDNPAFKGDGTKSSSPLNINNWTLPKNSTVDRKKPLDDSYAGTPAPKLVSLRGSDFTGLGIECFGGLKEGIFVKKIAPQGPASGLVKEGDRITSLTIDFRHIVQEDAMTILSYASPYNVQIEIVSGNNKMKGSEPSTFERSPRMGRQSPLVHPLYRSSSQTDLNTIERNSRKQLFPNDDKDYPTLKMDKNVDNQPSPSPTTTMMHKENEKLHHGKKSPSLKQQFKDQISKIEEKFQNRSHDKHKMNSASSVGEKVSDEMANKDTNMNKENEGSTSPKEKKGLKFGIRVFPPTVNEKLFGKKSKEPEKEPEAKIEDVKIDIDQVDTKVEIQEEFNRQGSVTSSGIKRDKDGIPQELPEFMMNAANAAKDGRKSNNNSDSKKSKGKAPRPPMSQIDLNTSTDTMDTSLNMTMTDISSTSISNITANNTNNANMELEDELDRITEKYLSQSRDKMNFSDNFANTSNVSIVNKTDDSMANLDKIDTIKDNMNMDDINDVILRQKEPSNTSTPKSERKSNGNNFISELDTSDIDLPGYGQRLELNSSDITVHQANEVDDLCDENRRAASLGDLSKFEMKKSLSDNNNVNSSTLERAQSLDITDNTLMIQKPSLALALSKNAADLSDLTVITQETKMSPVIYQMEFKPDTPKMESQLDEMNNELTEDTNKTDQTKINLETNIPDDIKVTRYPFGSLERPKSDVLKKLMSQTIDIDQKKPTIKVETDGASSTPSIVMMTPAIMKRTSIDPPMTNGGMKSIVTIDSTVEPMSKTEELSDRKTQILSIDTNTEESSQPVSLTLVNNTIDANMNVSQVSPIFSSNNMGINSIKISTSDFMTKPTLPQDKLITTTTILNNNDSDKKFSDHYFVKDNVVTISTDSQPSSIHFIDDVKLDFNMQVLDDIEKEDVLEKAMENHVEMNGKPEELHIITEIQDEIRKVHGDVIDLEINNNISKTTIIQDDENQQVINETHKSKFSTEIKLENINDESSPEVTPTTPDEESSFSSPGTPNITTTKTLTLAPNPLSATMTNFLKQEQRHTEKNFVPQNSEIKFTTAVYENSTPPVGNHQPKEAKSEKRISHIEQIRQNFEKSVQNSNDSHVPIPVARKSSIPLSINKVSPSKIPVLNSKSLKTSPTSLKTNGNYRHSVNDKNNNDNMG